MPAMIRCMLLMILMLALPARAGQDTAWQAYEKGDFETALTLFQAHKTASAHMGACQTGLVVGGFFREGEEAVRTLHRALDDCRTAQKLDPTLLEAKVSYAIGLAFEGKRVKKAKYAKRARALLEKLLEENPDNGFVHAALGGWHREVYEAGFFARMVLKAKHDTARDLLLKGLVLAPEDIGIRVEYIKLLAEGDKDDRANALRQLAILQEQQPRDAFDAFLQNRIVPLGSALAAADKRAIKAAIEQVTAFTHIRDAKHMDRYPLPD